MLLVAFWKRILPYGLTELRLLGILLGIWLLGIAVFYSLSQRAGIRLIPVTLAILLLVMLYGPFSVTRFSVGSQSNRFQELVAARGERRNEREASAALRFLLEHGARREIAAAIPAQLPSLDWERIADRRHDRDSTATQILAVAGIRYVPEWSSSPNGYFYLSPGTQTATAIDGYEWMARISPHSPAILMGSDSLRVHSDTLGLARVMIGGDTISFDLGALARDIAVDSTAMPRNVADARLRLHGASPRRRALLALESLNGRWVGDGVRVHGWSGTLFIGGPAKGELGGE
jgi:hypothetical protein